VKLRVPVAALVALALTLSACGGDDGDALDQVRDEADQIEDVSDDRGTDDSSSDAVDDATDDSSSDDSGDSTGLDDLPDMGELGDCLAVSMTYASLGLASLSGFMGGEELSDADLKELQKAIDELRGELPKELKDDFEVVAEVYGKGAKEGFMSSDFQKALESDKFTKADANIQKYLEEICG